MCQAQERIILPDKQLIRNIGASTTEFGTSALVRWFIPGRCSKAKKHGITSINFWPQFTKNKNDTLQFLKNQAKSCKKRLCLNICSFHLDWAPASEICRKIKTSSVYSIHWWNIRGYEDWHQIPNDDIGDLWLGLIWFNLFCWISDRADWCYESIETCLARGVALRVVLVRALHSDRDWLQDLARLRHSPFWC